MSDAQLTGGPGVTLPSWARYELQGDEATAAAAAETIEECWRGGSLWSAPQPA